MGESSTNDNGGLCGECPIRVLAVLDRLPPSAITALFITLAIGLTAVVSEILWLSWFYPSNLSTAIGVITPLLTLLFHSRNLIQQRRRINDSGDKDGRADISS